MALKSRTTTLIKDLKGKRLALGFACGACLIAALAVPAFAAPPGALPFGVYDPGGQFSDDPDVQIEHLFLPWEDVFLPSLELADEYAAERARAILVTIEPWTWTRSERNSSELLTQGITSGAYDGNIRAICDTLASFQSPVTVRWAQEMEDSSGQFIWAKWEPETYISAYRHVVDTCRQSSEAFDFMWSPLGYEDFPEYFPGEDYVDVIGLSVFGLQAWEQETLGQEQSFRDILTPRYERALEFDLPIVVAELGYVGDSTYVERWDNDVRQDLEGFPELEAVIYFNQQEVYPWPDGFGLPDWRMPNNRLDEIQAELSD